MTHLQLCSEFMVFILDEASIQIATNKYGSQYQLIKDLITNFESAQQYRISNNQNKLGENSNQHQISRWGFSHLHFQIGHQS